jgi:hypothetical protein
MPTVFTEKLDSNQLGEAYKNRRLINKMSNVKIKFPSSYLRTMSLRYRVEIWLHPFLTLTLHRGDW